MADFAGRVVVTATASELGPAMMPGAGSTSLLIDCGFGDGPCGILRLVWQPQSRFLDEQPQSIARKRRASVKYVILYVLKGLVHGVRHGAEWGGMPPSWRHASQVNGTVGLRVD